MGIPGKLEVITSNVSTVMKNIQLTTEGVWYTSNSNKKIPKIKGTIYSNETNSVSSNMFSGSLRTNRNSFLLVFSP
jgi:hypothetical protein